MKKIVIPAFILSIFFIASCKKDIDWVAEKTYDVSSTTFLKINYGSLYTTNPSVQLSINGLRVSGLISGRTPFPGGGYNVNGSNFADYLKVDSGTNVLRISIPKRLTNIDSVLLYAGTLTLQPDKHYTAHITDTFAKTKLILKEDNLTPPGLYQSKYMFINMMPNVPFIDLYYGGLKVASNIPYQGSSPYFLLGVEPVALAWSIREAGSLPTSTPLATYTSSNTNLGERVYTAFALGYKGSSATNTRPYISFLLNK